MAAHASHFQRFSRFMLSIICPPAAFGSSFRISSFPLSSSLMDSPSSSAKDSRLSRPGMPRPVSQRLHLTEGQLSPPLGNQRAGGFCVHYDQLLWPQYATAEGKCRPMIRRVVGKSASAEKYEIEVDGRNFLWYDSSRLKKVFQRRDAMIGKPYASVAQSAEQLIRNY